MADSRWCDGKSGDCDAMNILQPFQHLKELLLESSNYCQQYAAKEVYRRFYEAFQSMLEVIDKLGELAEKFADVAPRYDYSKEIRGNGFRSLLSISQHCIHAVTELVHYCQTNWNKFYFRTHHYCLEVEAYDCLLRRTLQMLEYADRMIPDDGSGGSLFTETFPPNLMMDVEQVDRTCFYGRTLGFQFSSPGLRHFIQVVCVSMASFAEGYSNHKSNQTALAMTSVMNSGKYMVNPEMRAKMIVDVTQKTSMEFCKAFWNLTEHYGLQHIPLLLCPALKVNRVFHIPPEPFDLIAENGEAVYIAPPCSWSGLAPVQVRLLSYEWREGQSKDGNDNHMSYGRHPKPKSTGFILHMHGGGFVAQSSKSHEMYLRTWARELNVPILSVDYSLAPEAPFPRALEECFFVYAWALKNKDQLGTTAQFVCMAGDSAGGNLSVVTSMRAAQYGIRKPDSILAAYSPFNMQYVPTPSRVFSLMDPLLPTGLLGACLVGYSGIGKSPFDECTRDAIKPHLEKFSIKPRNVPPRERKSGSFLSRHRESKDSSKRLEQQNRMVNLSAGPACNSSWTNRNGSSVIPDSQENAKLSPMKNGILHSQENLGSVGQGCVQPTPVKVRNHSNKSDQPHSSEHCQEISHPGSQKAAEFCKESGHSLEEPSLSKSYNEPSSSSPSRHDTRRSKHLSQQNGVADSHVGVLFHKDGKECTVVANTVEDVDMVTGETRLFPIEEPGNLQAEKTCAEEKDKGQVLARARSMSQVPLPIAKNPFMSPLLATDEMLATLPPVDLVACTLDPILDDSVEFARRLKAVGNDVELYVLENLPHGFLTFNMVCQEAREGCELCVVCLKRALSGKRKAKHLEKAPVY